MRPEEATALLALARDGVRDAARGAPGPRLAPETPGGLLAQPRGNFVTLSTGADRALRGCCGTLIPSEALARELARNAWRSGREDPRFPPLAPGELPGLHLEISLIGPLRRLHFQAAEDLLAQLEPGETGLLIAAGERRATFLPKVWDQLPDPVRFLAALRRKAGIAPAFPVERLEAWRYEARCLGAPFAPARAA